MVEIITALNDLSWPGVLAFCALVCGVTIVTGLLLILVSYYLDEK